MALEKISERVLEDQDYPCRNCKDRARATKISWVDHEAPGKPISQTFKMNCPCGINMDGQRGQSLEDLVKEWFAWFMRYKTKRRPL
jgi:hypothetical protein